MIEEQARVVQVGGGMAWIEAERKSACGSCGVNKGCGTAALAKAFPQRVSRMQVVDTLGVRPGQTVVVGMPEEALLGGAFWVYLVPLLTLFAAGWVGDWLGEALFASSAELFSIMAAAAGLYGGYRWARHVTRQRHQHYQPTLLRIQEDAAGYRISLDQIK